MLKLPMTLREKSPSRKGMSQVRKAYELSTLRDLTWPSLFKIPKKNKYHNNKIHTEPLGFLSTLSREQPPEYPNGGTLLPPPRSFSTVVSFDASSKNKDLNLSVVSTFWGELAFDTCLRVRCFFEMLWSAILLTAGFL